MLQRQLINRQADMTSFNDYYSGDHPLPFVTRKDSARMAKEFKDLMEDSRTNFCRLVVDAVEERMRVEGFHTGGTDKSDDAAWKIWQANQMDVQSNVAFIESLVKGVSYLSVWDDMNGDGLPDIAIEDPLETIVAYAPGSNYRARLAALKIWRDDWTGLERADLYFPNAVYKFQRKATADASVGTQLSRAVEATKELAWEEIGVASNPFGVVPIIPIRNRPRLLVEGESELADISRIQDQINGMVFLMMLAGYMGAHRQRWATGLQIMEDSAGNPVEPFNPSITRLWQAEDPNVKFGDFEQTSLEGYLKAIEQKVLHIAVTTRTPRHYLIEQGQSPSGDAIKSAESGLTQKVVRKQRAFGEALEEAMRLARRIGNGEEDPASSEVVWADAAIRTEAEITDATVKKQQAGLISHEQALEDMGYTPQQIKKIVAAVKQEKAEALEEQRAQLEMQASLRPDPAPPNGQ